MVTELSGDKNLSISMTQTGTGKIFGLKEADYTLTARTGKPRWPGKARKSALPKTGTGYCMNVKKARIRRVITF